MKNPTPGTYIRKIQAPYKIVRDGDTFYLLKNGIEIRMLRAQSADGADREAALFLGI